MSAKHLGKGDAFPALRHGVLRLYSMTYSPYAQRARLVLAAKKIEHEVVNISFGSKPEWFFQKNILGKVPVLEWDNTTLTESLVISDYLDEVYPTNPLHPKDLISRSRDRGLVHVFESKVAMPMIGMLFDRSNPKENLERMLRALEVFEKDLTKRNTNFFGGNTPGMLDYMIWPTTERLGAIEFFTGGDIRIPSPKQKLMLRWIEQMKEDEAVQESYRSPEKHAKFFMGGSKKK